MKNKTRFLISTLFLSANIVTAQSARSPNQQEMAAINKTVSVVVPVVNHFLDNNWELVSGGADTRADYSVQINPDVPIGVAPFNDWDLSVRQNSPLWNTQINPLLRILQNPPEDYNNKKAMDDYEKIRNQFQNLYDIFIEVQVNKKNIIEKPDKGNPKDLKIPGCYFSWKLSNDPNKQEGIDRSLADKYVLVFGNWENAKPKSYGGASPVYEFPFTHPRSTPFIENIVFIISGNDKRIQELLHKIDWNEINKGLTL